MAVGQIQTIGVCYGENIDWKPHSLVNYHLPAVTSSEDDRSHVINGPENLIDPLPSVSSFDFFVES